MRLFALVRLVLGLAALPVLALRALVLVALPALLAVVPGCDRGSSGSENGGPAVSVRRPDFTAPLPGAPRFDRELVRALETAWEARGQGYAPRTRHVTPDGAPKYTNRLFLESSPYLRQHAHNPVNWYPWGDEAFRAARQLGRPVLLSVGYSTCHWCHVMEEESFEDEEIAQRMNSEYIAIKVDREERPDVDAIYMSAVQMLSGRGGWPMTVWLTADRKPFYGGTYFPARDGDRGARAGFLTMLRKLREVFDQQPEQVAQASAELASSIQKTLGAGSAASGVPGAEILHAAFRHYRASFDSVHGGTLGAPKFPSNLPVRFLLRYQRRTRDEEALRMATLTLEKMAAGGMYDHVGGGFHRYSTDERWLVPHFEKMLYDNALLAIAYLEGHQATGREDFARVAREILRYVERDMTSPEGAFYSATDADSRAPGGHMEEGWFFTWTPVELVTVLGAEPARLVGAYYGVTPAGNFEGRSILHTPRSLEDVARDVRVRPEELEAVVRESRERLYAARAARPAPHRDEKILTAWNGLMISALARAALGLGDQAYAARAGAAATFVLGRMREDGRLRRSFKDGRARHNAYLDDYAFLAAGLLDLYEATGEARWLREAIALDAVVEKLYEDATAGGYFMTSSDHEELLAREKPAFDGAEPSGNSVAALVLLRLHELTLQDRYRERAERTLQAFGARLAQAPAALSEMLLALDFHLDTPFEVVIVVPASGRDAEPLLAELRRTFLPNRILAVVAEGAGLREQAEVVPLVAGKQALNGQSTAYVCERGVCKLPTSEPSEFAEQIRKVRPLGP